MPSESARRENKEVTDEWVPNPTSTFIENVVKFSADC